MAEAGTPLQDVAPMRWRPILELADRYHQPLLLASPVLIDGDKNPLGITDGFWQDGEGWVVADWCMCHDTFHRRVLAEHAVTHFCIPNGPWSGDELDALETDAARPVATAITDVLAERRRQIEAEGWTPEHDDGHEKGELARAAACYAAVGSMDYDQRRFVTGIACMSNMTWLADLWPWNSGWWKPKDRRRDLLRAAALIIAEIERLDRSAEGGA